jgi:protein-S-isoprenylcysteine O-methyltransferase Ste14
MLLLIRHLFAIAALPFVVAVLVPLWLARRYDVRLVVGGSVTHSILQVAGLALLLAGLTLFASSLRRFAVDGRGTLAPWDPPRTLVVRGPYRYVRNPMISGVAFVLFGEAVILGSRAHLWWAVIFLAINAVYIPLLEEPLLAARFAGSYDEYRRNVPRLLPRLRPWDPPDSDSRA